jgi:hypothetical protein
MGRDINFLQIFHLKNNINFAKPEKVLRYIICSIVKKYYFQRTKFCEGKSIFFWNISFLP